jgi:hypothetical protein
MALMGETDKELARNHDLEREHRLAELCQGAASIGLNFLVCVAADTK